MDIATDFEFAKGDRDELPTTAALLKYVTAINPEATKKEFVAAAVAAGYHPNTAAIQFAQSRVISLSCGDVLLLPDGRLVDNPDFQTL